MSSVMLQARELSFCFEPGKWVLDKINFELRAGEMLGVIGPNGSGKSTLIRVLSSVLKPAAGEFLIQSRPASNYSRRELARKIAVVPQQSVIEFQYRVLEVVLMGRAPHLGRFRLESGRDLEIARRALELTDCLELLERVIDQVSGGERQRVILARALAQEPEILLADEPTTHLDLHHQMRFMSLLAELRDQKNIAVLFTTHDLNMASIFADRILVLDQGRVAGFGKPEDALNPEAMSRIYRLRLQLVPNAFGKRPLIVPALDK